MRITQIRVKLSPPTSVSAPDRLRGFCSITLDGAFVVRDIKIIDGPHGVFVAMPSRKLMDHCPHCRYKNHLRARFCNQCGQPLDENRIAPALPPGDLRVKLHCDVAHPINAACRNEIQTAIIQAYQEELERSHQPGYVPQRLDDLPDDLDAA